MSSSSSAPVLSLNIDATKNVEDSENLGDEPDQAISNEDFNHTYANIGNHSEIKTEEEKNGIFNAKLMILSAAASLDSGTSCLEAFFKNNS